MQTIAYTNFDPDANRIIGMTNALWDIETSIDSRSSSAGGIPSTLTSTVFTSILIPLLKDVIRNFALYTYSPAFYNFRSRLPSSSVKYKSISPLSLLKGKAYSVATTCPFIMTDWKPFFEKSSKTSGATLLANSFLFSIYMTEADQLRIVSIPPFLLAFICCNPSNAIPLTACLEASLYNFLKVASSSLGKLSSTWPPRSTFNKWRNIFCCFVLFFENCT